MMAIPNAGPNERIGGGVLMDGARKKRIEQDGGRVMHA